MHPPSNVLMECKVKRLNLMSFHFSSKQKGGSKMKVAFSFIIFPPSFFLHTLCSISFDMPWGKQLSNQSWNSAGVATAAHFFQHDLSYSMIAHQPTGDCDFVCKF